MEKERLAPSWPCWWQWLLPFEKASLIYGVLTSLLMIVFVLSGLHFVSLGQMVLMRVEWLAMTVALVALGTLINIRYVRYARYADLGRVTGQLAWLAMWYPDTYEFNRLLPNLDHLFASVEETLFGGQPSLMFSELLPQAFWSEAFNLGYWSYFPMIAALVLTLFFTKRNYTLAATTILTAFFIYYAIYIFLPVAGPQFYFAAVGKETIEAGQFPALGTYFSAHTEMLPAPGYADGLFYQLVHAAQATGERPTAAFPSSHIGISTILLLLAYRHGPKALLCCLLPLWALLCCATVYIQAHYLIDAIAGLLSAPLVLALASWIVAPQRKKTIKKLFKS